MLTRHSLLLHVMNSFISLSYTGRHGGVTTALKMREHRQIIVRSWVMGSFHVPLVLLLWIFTTECKVPDPFNVSCRDITGHVGKESTLNCQVSYPDKSCCMMMVVYINTPDTEIYREVFRKDPCLQFTSFSCPYTAKTSMTETFKFFLQTKCDNKTTEFTVNITGDPNHPEANPTKEVPIQTGKAWISIVIAAPCCLIIFVMGFILRRKLNTFENYDLYFLEKNFRHTDTETANHPYTKLI